MEQLGLPGMDYNTLLRVTVLPNDCVEVSRIGSAAKEQRKVTRVSALPNDVVNKLAVLNMRSYIPPTEYIEGVGRRISKDVFWVFVEE